MEDCSNDIWYMYISGTTDFRNTAVLHDKSNLVILGFQPTKKRILDFILQTHFFNRPYFVHFVRALLLLNQPLPSIPVYVYNIFLQVFLKAKIYSWERGPFYVFLKRIFKKNPPSYPGVVILRSFGFNHLNIKD